jgi:membrane-associated phospholipid phosphatase
MPKILKHGLKVLVPSLIFVWIAYFFLDKPITFWAYYHHLRQYVIFDYLTKIAVIFSALPLFIYPYVIIRFAYQKFCMAEKFLLTLANSLVISIFLKNILKLICSRYWTMTFKGNFSLIVNNAYGFNWFRFSALNNSFPSGHMTITVAGVSVIGLFFPKVAWIAWSIALLVVLGLLADYYHFLSDIVAGTALGYLVGYYAVQITQEKI